jgi:serine/threonine protein kinase
MVFTESTVDTQALDYFGDPPRDDDDEDVGDVITHDDRAGDFRDATETGRMRRDRSRADTARAYRVGAVLGSYRLLQQIGAGGMGRVFVAEHIRLGRRVALKVLRSEFSGNLEAVQRFFAEARAVNCISHENIIEVSDFVESQRGPSFYIMELLHGADLRSVQEREGILPLDRILRIAVQICGGLGAAHAAGIVHRDLKPDNIFLIERGGQRDFVKLLDFGVAKLSDTIDEAATFQSTVGMVVGTPDYMAPEQALGHPVNHLADVYATGVILYEMVAGRRPFVATSAREVMVQHLTAAPCRPSMLNPAGQIPEKLEALILACLAKEPGDRPQSMGEVERQLREVQGELPAREVRSPARQGSRRKPVLAGVAALLAVIVAASIWLCDRSLFASTPSLASAGERLRARFVGARNTPVPIARSQAAFTIESPTTPRAVPMPAPARHADTATPVQTPATPAHAANNPAAPPEKILRQPSSATTRSTTQPPPFQEHRHSSIDRDMVLDPFE